MSTKTSYSKEETEKLLKLYDEYGTENLDKIAEILERPVKSIRSKLVREKVYVASKSSYVKKSGKSKKELLREIEQHINADLSGLLNASKESLCSLIAFLEKEDK